MENENFREKGFSLVMLAIILTGWIAFPIFFWKAASLYWIAATIIGVAMAAFGGGPDQITGTYTIEESLLLRRFLPSQLTKSIRIRALRIIGIICLLAGSIMLWFMGSDWSLSAWMIIGMGIGFFAILPFFR